MPPEALQAIATRHQARYVERLSEQGMFNAVFALGDDLILRVPRAAPLPVTKTYKEQVTVPAARAVGVRTPAIITFDDSLELIATPYAVEREVKRRSFHVIWELAGHGVGRASHEAPEVLNFYQPDGSTKLTEGLVLAVEPMVAA